MHPVVALAHAVAAADDAELDRGTAGPVDAVLHPLGHLPQVIVAGDALAPRIGNANDRPFQILRGKSHGLQRGPVILIAKALQDFFTTLHKFLLTTSAPGTAGISQK